MNKDEINILADILAKKKIGADMFEKSYNVWLNDFQGVYANYGRSIFGDDVFCEANDDGYAFSIALYPDSKTIDSIEYIIWNFEHNDFLYIDEFNERLIHTSSFAQFIVQFQKIHPSIELPSVSYTATYNAKYDMKILKDQLGEWYD